MIVFWLGPIGLPIVVLILGVRGALPGTRSKENLLQFSSLGATSTSHISFFRWSSWASLVVPLIANVLFLKSSHFWFSPEPFHSEILMRHYAFMVSTIIAVLILLADVGFKQWRLFWLPLVSLMLTYLLYCETAALTGCD